MPKITRVCIDCGKERMDYPSAFEHCNHTEEYRCKACAIKYHKGNIDSRITKICIDCGKERTDYLSSFEACNSKEYRCRECSIRLKTNPRITKKCTICGKERTAWPSQFASCVLKEYKCKACSTKDLKWKESNKLAMENRSHNIIWLENNKKHLIKINNDPIVKTLQLQGRSNNLECVERHKDRMIKKSMDPVWIENNKKQLKKLHDDPDWKENNKLHLQKINKDSQNKEKRYGEKYKENHLISLTGQGFWYGHPIINNRCQKYCEIFEEVKPRARSFFNHTCVKCGKFETTKSFNVHHVFYEKKACCWLDDNGEYWTNLNIKNHERDYYIGENPNYFALLCDNCHSSTNGGYDNRKKSADELKKLIDEKYNGKSYYTEEEMIELGYEKISKTKWIKI